MYHLTACFDRQKLPGAWISEHGHAAIRGFGRIEDSVRGVRAERGAPRAAVSPQSNMNIEAERDRKNTRALDRTEVHDFHASHYGKPMIHFGRIHLHLGS